MEQPVAITLRLPGGEKLELAVIEPGKVDMRSEFDSEDPVVLENKCYFHIGRTEVTQAQWKAIMGNAPSAVRGDDLPVTNVSWREARRFCGKLNRYFGSRLPAGYHFDLPTAAQWKFAFVGGGLYPRGRYSGSNDLNEVAWYNENSGGKVHPVAKKKPNALHLYDMEGNVREWCRDAHDSLVQGGKLAMGNSFEIAALLYKWGAGPGGALVGHPSPEKPDFQGDDLGFRVALVPIK